ncbi:Ferredoxin-2 [Candidatus Cyrtobacter comes]|uniref:Ferredoxin n=1 Tax=Candidatus Cyrtobacter comes TaxID=675776 RepID=A0ABU5L6F1_9RICK|nr:ferredoxin FdxA [Candidatus Cyrtobacter comes]MDZ5761703.1 Ferredoxin-2 [Candidatus Cyrtobacter comes]
MAYVVTEKCIRCKYTDCVDVCPVDCFFEGEKMLVINPQECIDCGVCEPECPVGAIVFADDTSLKMQEINAIYSAKWKRIISKKPPLQDADKYKNEEGKFEKYFHIDEGEN